MKKRAMKKWIPKGLYCHRDGTKKRSYCKWLKYCGKIKLDKTNCEHANICKEACGSKPSNTCDKAIYRCEYLKYTDFKQDSFLWDKCKECGVKE